MAMRSPNSMIPTSFSMSRNSGAVFAPARAVMLSNSYKQYKVFRKYVRVDI